MAIKSYTVLECNVCNYNDFLDNNIEFCDICNEYYCYICLDYNNLKHECDEKDLKKQKDLEELLIDYEKIKERK